MILVVELDWIMDRLIMICVMCIYGRVTKIENYWSHPEEQGPARVQGPVHELPIVQDVRGPIHDHQLLQIFLPLFSLNMRSLDSNFSLKKKRKKEKFR